MMKIEGLDAVRLMLLQDQDKAVDAARKQMTRAAKEVQKEAVLNAPVDLGNLEKAIQIDSPRTSRAELKEITVYVASEAGGVDVGRYAEIVHERYGDPGGPAGTHGPGPGTLSKMAANPGRFIGKKYLERAGVKVDADYTARMSLAVKSVI